MEIIYNSDNAQIFDLIWRDLYALIVSAVSFGALFKVIKAPASRKRSVSLIITFVFGCVHCLFFVFALNTRFENWDSYINCRDSVCYKEIEGRVSEIHKTNRSVSMLVDGTFLHFSLDNPFYARREIAFVDKGDRVKVKYLGSNQDALCDFLAFSK